MNHIYSYVAPKVFGGAEALGPVSGDGVQHVADAFPLQVVGTQMFGSDILIEYEVKNVYRNN